MGIFFRNGTQFTNEPGFTKGIKSKESLLNRFYELAEHFGTIRDQQIGDRIVIRILDKTVYQKLQLKSYLTWKQRFKSLASQNWWSLRLQIRALKCRRMWMRCTLRRNQDTHVGGKPKETKRIPPKIKAKWHVENVVSITQNQNTAQQEGKSAPNAKASEVRRK